MASSTRLAPASARLLAAVPFHVVLDRRLRVVRVGEGLARACPGLTRGRPLDGHLAIESPATATVWRALAAGTGETFVLRTPKGLALRGRFVVLTPNRSLAFVGVPDADAETLRAHGIEGADATTFGTDIALRHALAAASAERDAALRQIAEWRAAAEAHAEQRRARGEFLAGLAREIRTAVNGNLGVLGLLADSGLDAGQADLVSAAAGSSQGVLSMLDDVLDYSSLQFADFGAEVAPYDLHRLFADAVERATPAARERGLALGLEVAPDVPRYAAGPARRVQQVLHKLLDNALRFTERGAITVRLGLASDYGIGFAIRAEVCDTGVGIAREQRPRLFQEFSRLESVATGASGSGLGLAICQRIVKRMDGQVGMDSVPGKGSTFWFVVHQSAPDEGEVRTMAAAADTGRRPRATGVPGTLRVLVAEDSPVNHKVATHMLERLGFEWIVAENGREAVERFDEAPVDLVLMDCVMPVMDGFEATQVIRERARRDGRHVTVLALTANDTPEDRRRAAEAGMDGFITKPLRLEVLRKALSHFTGLALDPAA